MFIKGTRYKMVGPTDREAYIPDSVFVYSFNFQTSIKRESFVSPFLIIVFSRHIPSSLLC